MTPTRDRHSLRTLLREVGVQDSTYRALVAAHRGDEIAALRELLANVVKDAGKEPRQRKLAAAQMVPLERDRQERIAWQRAVHGFELDELATRGVVEAAIVSLNPDCLGCAALNNALIDVAGDDALARLPPRTCLHLEQGHSCCISFAPRVVAARVELQ
jgi:hypothetical protein